MAHPPYPPNATLVTACFYLNPETRPIERCMESLRPLMTVPAYMVIYTDYALAPVCRAIREELNLMHMTDMHVMTVHDIWTAQFEDKINANRAAYWPSRDPRAGTLSHLITCNKFDFVRQAMNRNVFHTTHFAWCDSMIQLPGDKCKIAEKFSPQLMLRVLQNLRDKFQVTVMNVNDKAYARPEHWREFYATYRWVICGCFFSLRDTPRNREILEFLINTFIRHTEAGYGHSEEMFYHEALDVFFDDMHRSYGDYQNILDNWVVPTRNLPYLMWAIVQRYMAFGYWRELKDVSTCMLTPMWSLDPALGDFDHGIYCRLMYCLYLANWHLNRDEASKTARFFRDLVSSYPPFAAAYRQNADFYNAHLSGLSAPAVALP